MRLGLRSVHFVQSVIVVLEQALLEDHVNLHVLERVLQTNAGASCLVWCCGALAILTKLVRGLLVLVARFIFTWQNIVVLGLMIGRRTSVVARRAEIWVKTITIGSYGVLSNRSQVLPQRVRSIYLVPKALSRLSFIIEQAVDIDVPLPSVC